MFQPSLRLSASVAAAAVLLVGAHGVEAQIARISGIVRDVDGTPLRGAIVTADPGSGSITATTDDNGRFAIIGMRAGVWKFEVQAPGYHTEMGEISVRAVGGGEPRPMMIALRRAGYVGNGPLARLPGDDIQSQLAAAAAHFDAGEWDQAIASYRTLLARAPSLTAIHLQIAAAHRHRGDYPAALASYDVVLKGDPDNERALLGVSTTHLELGDTQAAEQALLRAAEGAAPAPAVYFALGELQASQGRPDDAAGWYQKAAGADEAWGKPLYRLGELAIDAGDKAAAARYLSEVIAVDPASPEADLAQTALDRLNTN
jgi:tetratricopeptide (TPR) repeat protein